MLQLSDLAGLPSITPPQALASFNRFFAGPERRLVESPALRRMSQMLDEIDYGMLLLSGQMRVVHVNKAARCDLNAQHPLQLLGTQLRARHAHDALSLDNALVGAAQRGLRRLLNLGDDIQRISVSVVPLPELAQEPPHAVLLVLGRRRMCEELTVDCYARSHGLTAAESAVIKGLCADLSPRQIAQRQGVGLATVRTQIGSIRFKTGVGSIKALVRQVAMLPPLVSALQGLTSAGSQVRLPEPRRAQLSHPMMMPGAGPQRRAVPA